MKTNRQVFFFAVTLMLVMLAFGGRRSFAQQALPQSVNADQREFVSTLLPNIMGDQLVAVGYSEGSFNVNEVRKPQSKRIALHKALDSTDWYDQWLIGAKPGDTNYAWDDSRNWTLHPAGGVANSSYEALLKQTRESSGGIPRNSFVECIVDDVAVMRETEIIIETVKEAKGRIWYAPLALFSPAQQRYMKKEYWRLMPASSSLKKAMAQDDLFAKICANEFRFVDHKILQEAAAQGDCDALNVLGRCYLEGVCYGDLLREAGEGNIERWLPGRVVVQKDTLKGVELLKAAAEKGNIDACVALGEHLCKQPDKEHIGRLYYLIAAYVGHPLAHLNLALKYRNMTKEIPNVTSEQRERRAVWHLLCAVNCNRMLMSLRVRGEAVRVMCYDFAADALDKLENPYLREYAKSEKEKIRIPWPMSWDRSTSASGVGILTSAEVLQNEIDSYFKAEAKSSNGQFWLNSNAVRPNDEPQDASTAPPAPSLSLVERIISQRAQGGAGQIAEFKDILPQVLHIKVDAELSTLANNLGVPKDSWEGGLIPRFDAFWRSAVIPGIGSYFLASELGRDVFVLKEQIHHNFGRMQWVGILPANYGAVVKSLNYPFVKLKCAGASHNSPGWEFVSEESPTAAKDYPSRFGIRSVEVSDFIQKGDALLTVDNASHFVLSVLPLYPKTSSSTRELFCISPALLKSWMKRRKTPAIEFLQFGDTISDAESKLVENKFLLGKRVYQKFSPSKRVMLGRRMLEAKQNSFTILASGAEVCSSMNCKAVGMLFDVPILIDMSFVTYFPDYENPGAAPDMFLVKAEIDFFPESLARNMPGWIDANQTDIDESVAAIRTFFAKTSNDLRRQKRISIQSELEKLMRQAGFKRREAVELWQRQNLFRPGQVDSLICEVAPRDPAVVLIKDNVHAYFSMDEGILQMADESGMMLGRISSEYFEWLNVVLEVVGSTNQLKKNPFLPK